MDNVILIGFMGCGKTTVGRKLSYRLRRPILDTDKEIEREAGCTISEIFETEGEQRFRDMETECLRRMLGTVNRQIISVGGGLPLREENRELLRKLGQVVYLRAEAQTIYDRVKHDTTRPLLQGGDPLGKIRAMLKERGPVYEAAAETIIDVDDRSFEEILTAIEREVTE